MITCLNDYIGIRGECTEVDSLSGLYINDLPGMDRNYLEALSDNETEDFVGVWNKVYKRAKNNFVADVLKWLPSNIRVNNVIGDGHFGEAPNETTDNTILASAEYRGVYFRVKGSELLTGIIARVSIYSRTAVGSELRIFDTLGGELLHSETLTLVAGWNMIEVSFSARARGDVVELFVGYDGTNVISLETGASGNCSGAVATLKGATAPVAVNIQEQSLTLQDHTSGLILYYQVGCAVDHLICKNMARLQNALLYKCGIELLIETLMHNRFLSVYTLQDREIIKDNIGMFNDFYQNEVEQNMKNIKAVTDRRCVTCKSKVNSIPTLPG
jgi:hypothetical protein